MSTNVPQRTATIIPFPVGGRRAVTARVAEPVTDAAASLAPAVTTGAWYHDAAIQDSKRAGER